MTSGESGQRAGAPGVRGALVPLSITGDDSGPDAGRLIVSFVMRGRPKPWQRNVTRDGRQVMHGQTLDYQRRIRSTATAAMFRRGGPVALPGAPVAVDIAAYYRWPKAAKAARRSLEGPWAATQPGDWDNIAKTFCDALQESKRHGEMICYKDDRQVVRGVVEKRRCETEEEERVEISIWDITPTEGRMI